MSFSATDSSLFYSSKDSSDPRLGDLVHPLPATNSPSEIVAAFHSAAKGKFQDLSEKKHFLLAGYPDDEGIRINGGRPGASEAPDQVRRPLYRMTPSALNAGLGLLGGTGPHSQEHVLWDAGNLNITAISLEQRHQILTDSVRAVLNLGAAWVGIGGGHDYGFADAAAFIEALYDRGSNERPLILNFDAHLDVRPTTSGLSSGTPFFRMLEKYPDVDFAEIGIQSQCNSRSHLEWVKARGARVLTQDEVEASGESFTSQVMALLGNWILRPRPVFLSVDIDAFSSSVAPGCSQSWATGLTPHEFFPCLQTLARRLDVRMLGIYEVSPPLDHDNRTAKLAAQIIHRVIA